MPFAEWRQYSRVWEVIRQNGSIFAAGQIFATEQIFAIPEVYSPDTAYSRVKRIFASLGLIIGRDYIL